MSTDPPAAAEDPREPRLLHVSRAQFAACLVVSLTIFFFATGPLWRHAADIRRLDTAIFWSYGAIPLLIAACLLASRRWSLRGFLLDTLALTLTKYVLTATIAGALWISGGDPAGVAPPAHAAAKPAAPEPVAAPSKIDPAQTGEIDVLITDAAGKPVAGALAYVAGGLEGYVFAVPAEPVALANDGKGVTPALAVAQIGQSLEGRSTDGRLHTLVVRREGATLFNVPLLSSGGVTTVHAGDARDGPGLATVRCNVHPQGEAESRLLLVTHPFHGWSDAAGRVVLRGVPAGALRIAVLAGEAGGEESVQLGGGKTVEVRVGVRAVAGP